MRALAILAVLSLASAAHADKKLAAAYFRAGEKAYLAQNFEAAAENLDAAFKELPAPELAFSAAQAYRRAHRVKSNVAHVARSIELYKFYLSKVTEGGRVADAADNVGEMERELVALGGVKAVAPAEQKTRVALTVTLVGLDAAVSMRELEDRRAGAAPEVTAVTKLDGVVVKPDQMIEVTPGPHVVRAEAPGFAPLERTHDAVSGKSELVELELQPLPAKLLITTEKGARVSVDGRGIGAAPVTPVELAAGRHTFTIIRTGREPVAREVVLERGQSVTVSENLAPTERRRAVTWVFVGAGLGALFTTTTAIAAMHQDGVAEGHLRDLELGNQDPALRNSYASARDLRNQLRTSAYLAGAATITVGIVAVALYYFDNPSAEGLRVTPIATSTGGGAAVIGRF